MSKVRVAGFSLSIDGFGAGVEQSLTDPLGKRGRELFQWFFGTRTFRAMFGETGGSQGTDETYAARSMAGFGAFILGRNMFGPIRGAWPDGEWKGWWDDNPPYHAPTFILTHHRRDPLTMEGGTTFHFVTDGIEAALDRAKAAAGDNDVKIGGARRGRRLDDPPVPAGRPRRRDALGHRTRRAGTRRSLVRRRFGPACPGLQGHRARRHRTGHARGAHPIGCCHGVARGKR